jgi:hypothetical protein
MLAFATSVLSGLSDLLAPFAGADASAPAVVLFTIAVRLAAERRPGAGNGAVRPLRPVYREIRQRYGDQPDRLRGELAALGGPTGNVPALTYPFAPTLVQMRCYDDGSVPRSRCLAACGLGDRGPGRVRPAKGRARCARERAVVRPTVVRI